MKAADLAITGIGAITPVGLSAPATCAALRAGIARMKELPGFRVEGEAFATVPAVGGRVPTEWLSGGPAPWEWPGHERFGAEAPPPPETRVPPDHRRLAELAALAAREAFEEAGAGSRRPARLGLYAGLPDGEAAPPVLGDLPAALGCRLDPVVPFAAGRAAALLALQRAAEDLAAGRADAALVVGVDSLIRAPVLARLYREGLLRCPSCPEGVIPGEGAAALFLEKEGRAAARGARPRAALLSAAVAEEATAGTDRVNQAAGLTAALREAAADAGGLSAPPLVVCDLNGDRYRALEWGMASIRTLGALHGEMPLWHPADCTGDPGAASGAVNLVWAVTAFGRGYAQRDRAVVFGASDGRPRAAAVLGAVAPRKGGS